MISSSSIPRCTYRLQFHHGFRLNDATGLVPYLDELGVSHVYASPVFRASPGSEHGYDICDHNEINPEIGTEEDFDALVAALQERGMGLILDFVPNHMGIAEQRNAWWWDVLENGPASPYARFFDVQWHPLKPALENKVLLPILGGQYGRVLEGGELQLRFSHGAFTLHYYETVLPIDPQSSRCILRRAAELMQPAPDELASILTALENLPPRTETREEKIVERAREKGIIRERLQRLCEADPVVEEAVQTALKEWQRAEDLQSHDRLDALISDQPYRLSFWRVAAEEINYRRFFDINTLAAIRVELPEVFDATHKLLLRWISEGKVDGVRIDHIDGLALPASYLQQLRSRMDEVAPAGKRPYLVVEKILGKGESLPPGWPIHGTTGYEFAAQALNILVNPAAEKAMTECYERSTGRGLKYREAVYLSKRLIMNVAMASEVNMLGTMLSRLAESHRWYRDFTVNALTSAVREVIACFPVYRTYLVPGAPPHEADIKVILTALAQARRRNPALERSVFEFLQRVLLPAPEDSHPVNEELRQDFVLKFQQCTGPIMAKGVEDTAFYIYNRHVALNEVGGQPSAYGMTVDAFHRQTAARQAQFPHSMLATTTHDTKRSEDTRMRILALSELPHEWSSAVRRWRLINRKFKEEIDGEVAPDDNEEFLLYQILLGTWPLEPMNEAHHQDYVARIQTYMNKALHEAKINSSWIEPNARWDEAVGKFVEAVVSPRRNHRFLESFIPLAERLARLGAVNSLSETVLKLTQPGVPDLYQGTELWDLSLVDPDNRRPVDYAPRQQMVHSEDDGWIHDWRDGRIKLKVIQKLLALRRSHPLLFEQGSYEPLNTQGAMSEHCVAYQRAFEGQRLLVIVPRLTARLGIPPVGQCWQDTHITGVAADVAWRSVLTGTELPANSGQMLSVALAELPVAVLVNC